jgi:hypothetical protein
MNEKSVPFKKIEPGLVISQGRGGQAIIQDVIGSIFLTTQNKTGSNQQTLSVNDSISSIALLSGEAPTSIDTKIEFPSNNFNTINWEQTPIGGVQIVQPVYKTTSSSLDVAVDILPTQSVIQNNTEVQPQESIPFLTSSLFLDEQLLPDEEIGLYDNNIVGTGLKLISFLDSNPRFLSNPSSTKIGKVIEGAYDTSEDNNPFNVIGSSDNWNGKIGIKQAKNSGLWFIVFNTVENGIRAGLINLSGYFTRYNANTIEKIINRYAPGGSLGQTNEATNTYKQNVLNHLKANYDKNIKLNTVLSFKGKNETNTNNIKMFKELAKIILKIEDNTSTKYWPVIDKFDIKNLN